MTIKCIAVDDEPLALDLLEDNIKQVPFLQLVKSCRNAFEAIEVLQTEKIDLVFLDIQMPGLTGTQFVQSMPEHNKPMVIFITAYEEYAVEGFNLDVVDYLLKPVSFERFLKAANKAQEFLRFRHQEASSTVPSHEFLFVNADYSLVKIRLADVTYVEGLKDYVKIHLTTSTRPVITRLTMKTMEEKLPADQFIRVHKSFIVSLDKIESIRNLKIKIGSAQIPVSEHYSEAFFKVIDAGRME
ncbi:MAG: LytTR family DNA-binding domain-containing protein [Spirosomataceae bacterium]